MSLPNTPVPLSLFFTEEKGKPPVKPKDKHVLSGYHGVLWKENNFI